MVWRDWSRGGVRKLGEFDNSWWEREVPVKIAVVGVGYWGSKLLRVFSGLDECVVAAICDIDPVRVASLRSHHPETPIETNYDNIINRADIDAVVIALPPHLHFEYCRRALECGKHCFVEKPITTTSSEAQALIAAAETYDRRLMVGHTFEFHPAVHWVDDFIQSGDLGDVLHIFSQRMNLGIIRDDTDALWNLAPHDISMIFYWLHGELPKCVSCRGHSFLRREHNIIDMAWLTMEFETNAVAQVQVSWLSPEKIRQTMVVGSKRMVVFDDVSVESKIKVFDKGVDRRPAVDNSVGYGEFQLIVRTGDVVMPKLPGLEPLREEAKHFIECVVTGKRPVTDGENGLRVLKTLELARQSIETDGASVQFS